jgi:hypothetical protein
MKIMFAIIAIVGFLASAICMLREGCGPDLMCWNDQKCCNQGTQYICAKSCKKLTGTWHMIKNASGALVGGVERRLK